MSSYLDRSIQLLGKDKILSFKDKVVLVAGIGGVGGTALEALARSGFTKFVIIDFKRYRSGCSDHCGPSRWS